MGLHFFFLTNFPGAMFIQGATFIPDSRVENFPVNRRMNMYKNCIHDFFPLLKIPQPSLPKYSIARAKYAFNRKGDQFQRKILGYNNIA